MAIGEARFQLRNSYNLVQARQYARQMAREMGFDLTDQTRIATAVSEVGRQMLNRTGRGEVVFRVVIVGSQRLFECTCLAGRELEGAFAPEAQSPLSGVGRLMDACQIKPREGDQVAVTMRKELPRP